MLFTSAEFLFLFFPIVLGFYYVIPRQWRNYWLLVSSLFFYAWGEPKFVFIMGASVIINYLFALGISKCQGKRGKKVLLVLSVFCNLALLMVFKYMNFLTANLAKMSTFKDITVTEIALPIGISFFTFQAMSYVIDVYRGIPVQKNPAYVGMYISFFPQLIAGPIVRYTTIMEQITSDRKVNTDDFFEGIYRFLVGFNKKMLFANTLGEIADTVFASSGNTFYMAWLGALCYSMQIFFDFSGYSDMAIGLGRMFGFHFLENFRLPYMSKTISEFWQRWHISLGSWFRDYVYFPMGGSRVSKLKMVRNLFIVWLLTGIWHGANWTFIVWGLMYGVIITIEKVIGINKYLEKSKALQTAYRIFTLVLVVCGWVVFRADSLTQGAGFISTMFSFKGVGTLDTNFLFHLKEYRTYILFGILCCTPFFSKVHDALPEKMRKWEDVYKMAIQLILFLVSISFIIMNYHNPFIYFNF